MLFVMSCENGNDLPKNSNAKIIALTVSVNGNDYDISFDADNTALLIIPAAETVPGKVRVAAVSLPDGATGLAMGEKLTITDGKIVMTITAEDGSTQSEYTLAIMAQIVEEMPKTQAMDRRYHYVAFTVQSKSRENLGRFKFGLKAAEEKAPTASELADGAGIYRKVTSLALRNILAYTLDSGIGTYVSSSEVQNKVVLHGNNEADVDQYLLVPDGEYALYAMKDGSDTAFKLATFSTDVFDENSSPFEDGKISDRALMEGQYVYDPQDAVFLMPYFLAADSLLILLFDIDNTLRMRMSSTYVPLFGNTGWSALFPSQMTDGTNYYRTIAGKRITGFFACIPQAKLGIYTSKIDVTYIPASGFLQYAYEYQLTQN